MLTCNIRSSKGSGLVEFAPEMTLFEFLELVAEKSGILPKDICIRKGFPPKFLETQDLSVTVESMGIADRDSLMIEENPSNSLYSQAGIVEDQEEEVKEIPSSMEKETDAVEEEVKEDSDKSKIIKRDPNLKKVLDTQVQTPDSDGKIMIRRIIDADNSCLFNSIGCCLLGSKQSAKDLRRMVRDTIKSNSSEYEAIIDKPLSEYLTWIMNDESWGGGIELYILSKLLSTEFYVITVESLNAQIFGEGQGYKQRIYLLYTGIHYDIVTRNIFEGCEEDDDIRAFEPTDKFAEDGALFVANELRKKKQFVNLDAFGFV
mmetsp:Transcript_36161/g.35760  ORF Transcript_36161/g.35760 Transcript_36161/m.35760 type:complete len:317 (-) Transcript_36161:106-1056(-)